MTNSEILQLQVMERFWGKLTSLTDSELMTRRQMEIEKQGSLKRLKDEICRRNAEL